MANIEMKSEDKKPFTFSDLQNGDIFRAKSKDGYEVFLRIKHYYAITDKFDIDTVNAVSLFTGCFWAFDDDDPVEKYEETLYLNEDAFK